MKINILDLAYAYSRSGKCLSEHRLVYVMHHSAYFGPGVWRYISIASLLKLKIIMCTYLLSQKDDNSMSVLEA